MKTSGGDILLKTTERRFFGSEFEEIPIKSTNTGTEVKFDIATSSMVSKTVIKSPISMVDLR